MSHRLEKKNNGDYDIVIDGWEKGVAPSPHEGLGNIQGANISTEMDEIMSAYRRTLQSQVSGTGTLTQVNTNTVSVSGINLLPGSWIHITSGGTTGLSGDYYYLSTGKLATAYHNSASQPVYSRAVSYLLVGGGGGGGSANGTAAAGGGAGEVTSGSSTVTARSYDVVVGTGGGSMSNGTNTTFSYTVGFVTSTVTARGGSAPSAGVVRTGGASGGGTYSGGTDGGLGAGVAGGGAGSSANGSNATGGNSGGGGAGTASSISGASVTYGGGGGGGSNSGNNSGSGGSGGGGAGGNGPTTVGANATGIGSGGGGAGGNNVGGGNGTNGTSIFSYPTGTLTATGGTITTSGGNTIHTFTSNGTFTVSSLSPTSYAVTGITSGSATFSVYSMGSPVQGATETYYDTNSAIQYRYYILDSLGQVWVHDTSTLSGVDTPLWFMTELPPTLAGRVASGLAVLNGWLTITLGTQIYFKPTSALGSPFTTNSTKYNFLTNNFHGTLTGHQGKLYSTDGNFLTSMFPSTSLVTGSANIQSTGLYVNSNDITDSKINSLTAILGGSVPYISSTVRTPVFFYTDGTLPTAIIAGTIYYIEMITTTSPYTFYVYSASTGGSKMDTQTGALGNQYFTTFYPLAGGDSTITYTAQRVNLPYNEIAQSLGEIGNSVLIGCKSSSVYLWDQVSALPIDFIDLPENNVTNIITVNNTGYIFAGQKGNIYITNGSSASPAISVPDYCAGIAGTPSTYVEQYFTWGGAAFFRGRVFFSILDQTSTKAGNCGGIWSFVPTDNYASYKDVGLSLRLENQSSYGTYSGVAPVIIASRDQLAKGPQYWSAWYSDITTPVYGIDFSDTVSSTGYTIESDLIPTGTMLEKTTYEQIEYKLSSPLVAGESVSVYYRQNATDSFVSMGTAKTESTTDIAGYFPITFQKGQWLQLRVVVVTLASSLSSFGRLKEIRIR